MRLSPNDLAVIDYILNRNNCEEYIKELLNGFSDKSPDNVSKLSDYVKQLHDLKVKYLIGENKKQYKALEWISHFFEEKKDTLKYSVIAAHEAAMVLFPEPLKWKETNHSEATKDFFLKFMKMYPNFRYDSTNKWFEDFSNPKWWEEVEKLYLRDFSNE